MFKFFKSEDATSADLVHEYAEAETKKQELETRRATVRQRQVELLADGFNGEDTAKAATKIRAEYDDLSLQTDILTEIQQRIRTRLAALLRDEKEAQFDQISRDLAALREARQTAWREFLVAAAKAAILKERIEGLNQIVTATITRDYDPDPNLRMSLFDADDREFYSLAVMDARGGPPPKPGIALDLRISDLVYHYRQVSQQIQDYDPDRAVADALKAAVPDVEVPAAAV